MRSRRSIAIRAAICVIALCAVGVACSDSGSGQRATPTVTTSPAFKDVPRVPGSRVAGTPSRSGSTEVQSFFVHQTALYVLQFYRNALRRLGWRSVEDLHSTGTTDYAGTWENGRLHLLVTAGPASAVSSTGSAAERPVTQYSLTITR